MEGGEVEGGGGGGVWRERGRGELVVLDVIEVLWKLHTILMMSISTPPILIGLPSRSSAG